MDERFAYRLFYASVVLAAAISLAGPDLLYMTQAAAERWAMIAFLPVCVYVAYALRPKVTPDETGAVDH